MDRALAMDTRSLVLDLHELMRELDPVRWRRDLEGSLRARFMQLSASIDRLQERYNEARAQGATGCDEWISEMRESFDRLSREMRESFPGESARGDDLRRQWLSYRKRLQPCYDELATTLRGLHIQVPSLRPTNWTRSIFHALVALGSLLLVELALGPASMIAVAGTAAFLAWFLEISRRYSKLSDRFSWFIFGRMAHSHERKSINSATWYTTALLAMSLTGSPMVCALSLGVLGFADPAAGLVGRRWGRHKLIHGRTLEGSLAFLGTGFVVALAIALTWHANIGIGAAILLALGASVAGGLAELCARRLDDNLLVPLASAAGAGLVASMLGLL